MPTKKAKKQMTVKAMKKVKGGISSEPVYIRPKPKTKAK